jgi:hypothetical protein
MRAGIAIDLATGPLTRRHSGELINAVLGAIADRHGLPPSSDARAARCDDPGPFQRDLNEGHARSTVAHHAFLSLAAASASAAGGALVVTN